MERSKHTEQVFYLVYGNFNFNIFYTCDAQFSIFQISSDEIKEDFCSCFDFVEGRSIDTNHFVEGKRLSILQLRQGKGTV